MRGYNFKFNKILNYKESIENIKKVKYGEINQKLIQEEEILEKYYNYKEEIITNKKESSSKSNIGHLRLINRYLDDISSTIENQEIIITDIKRDLELAKEELLEAMQEKNVFEKLKENHYNEYILELKREEEKIIDGIITFNNSSRE